MELFATGEVISPNFKVIPVTESVSLVSTDIQTEIGTAGIFSIRAICGLFEILGWKLISSSASVEVHSTKEFSLKISPVSSKNKNKPDLNRAYLESLNLTEVVISNILQHFESAEYLALVSVEESSMQFGMYLENYIGSPLYSKRNIEKSIISYDVNSNFKNNSIRIHQEWLYFASNLTKPDKKVIIVGGRNTGKSTLMKYLINKSLASNPAVLVLDFDPGQAEFTVMGCISAVLVTKPALGPNFSHLTTPVKSLYLGAISVVDYSHQYMDYVEEIFDFCSSVAKYHEIPWFVNTMGFNKGLGVLLITKIITKIKPTDVIQINSKNKMDNFPNNLTSEFISYNDSNTGPKLKYKLHVVPSVAKNSSETFDPTTSGLSNPKKRELVVLSYFYRMLNAEKLWFTDCIPYKFPLSSVRISITSNDSQLELNKTGKMITLNGNMIGLCYEEDSKSVEFRGFGIVRGVSFDDEVIYINTPMNEEELRQINVIHLASAIQLPLSVYKNRPDCLQGEVPYMAQIYPSRLNQLIKKSSSRIRPYDKRTKA